MAVEHSLLRAACNRLPVALAVVFALALGPRPANADAARTSVIFPIKGFEDDVDLVVAPNRGFVVVCEEDNSELDPAQVQILELDPLTGALVGPRVIRPALGFENGVDPIIVQMRNAADGWAVLIPEESQDGSHAGLLVLRVADNGVLLEEHSIDLTGLGFHPDVDGTWTSYIGPKIAFFVLESEDGVHHGAIAIDIDGEDSDGDLDPEFGSCHVIADILLAVCGTSEFADVIPGLADGVDPVSYEAGIAARLAVPVTGAGGSDLVLLDWDPHFEPPKYTGYISTKAANAATIHPLAFPGWERDVDISLFTGGECGAFAPVPWILLPVEDGAGNGDLYLVGPDGDARWVYSTDAGATAPPITGYEQGVDLLRVCGLGGDHPSRIIVPIENAGDADVVIVDLINHGEFLGHVEDPVMNPGTTVFGFEVGVEPLQWVTTVILVPMEGAGGAGILAIDPDGRVLSSIVGGPVLGFARSVDPIVAPLSDPDRTLFVPCSNSDGTDSNVLRYALPPNVTAPGNLETLNVPNISFSGFEWDVDLGLVKKSDLGSGYIMVPEMDRATGAAQLRFEPTPAVPAGRVLVVPVKKVGLTPASIFAFKTTDGLMIGNFTVLGLQTGLDLVTGRGPMITQDPPAFGVASGFDEDTDPTQATGVSDVGVHDPPAPGEWGLAFANPFRAPGRIAWRQPNAGWIHLDLVDVAGRRVRRIYQGWRASGDQFVAWDGRDAAGQIVGAGVYFLHLSDGRGWQAKAVVILR